MDKTTAEILYLIAVTGNTMIMKDKARQFNVYKQLKENNIIKIIYESEYVVQITFNNNKY